METVVASSRCGQRTLPEAAATAADREARQAVTLRAKRLASAFLLCALARRGFTSADGFPTMVVTLENLRFKPTEINQAESRLIRSTAARTGEQGFRGYPPVVEVVIDGRVNLSTGPKPAWEDAANAERIENLRTFLSRPASQKVHWSKTVLESCPHCGLPTLETHQRLFPARFLGDEAPHVGSENLPHVAAAPPGPSAHGVNSVALVEDIGQMRGALEGRFAVVSRGFAGGGFAIGLDCGPAHPPEPAPLDLSAVILKAMPRYRPLMLSKGLKRTHDGLCPALDNT